MIPIRIASEDLHLNLGIFAFSVNCIFTTLHICALAMNIGDGPLHIEIKIFVEFQIFIIYYYYFFFWGKTETKTWRIIEMKDIC